MLLPCFPHRLSARRPTPRLRLPWQTACTRRRRARALTPLCPQASTPADNVRRLEAGGQQRGQAATARRRRLRLVFISSYRVPSRALTTFIFPPVFPCASAWPRRSRLWARQRPLPAPGWLQPVHVDTALRRPSSTLQIDAPSLYNSPWPDSARPPGEHTHVHCPMIRSLPPVDHHRFPRLRCHARAPAGVTRHVLRASACPRDTRPLSRCSCIE